MRSQNAETPQAAPQSVDPVLVEPPKRVHRSRKSETRRWLKALVITLAIMAVALAGSLMVAVYVQARGDEIGQADTLIVLGAAQYNGTPSPVFQARLDRAYELYQGGVAPTIIVAGGRMAGDQFTEAESGRDYLVAKGVPASAVLMANVGENTWSSLQSAAKLMSPRDLHSAVIVSDGFHLMRAKIMARDLGIDPVAGVASDSPIRHGSLRELKYVAREAAAIVAHELSD